MDNPEQRFGGPDGSVHDQRAGSDRRRPRGTIRKNSNGWLRRVTEQPDRGNVPRSSCHHGIFLGALPTWRPGIRHFHPGRGRNARQSSRTTKSHRVDWSDGYDGQFFYRLSLNPFTASPRCTASRSITRPIDSNAFGFPLLVWIFSAGQPLLVIYPRPQWLPAMLNGWVRGQARAALYGGCAGRPLSGPLLWLIGSAGIATPLLSNH